MADSTKLSLIMGARNGALEEKDEYDFYATDPKALGLFLNKFNEDGECLAECVWEPACGNGHLSEVLLSRGHSVMSTDVVEREYPCEIKDFLADDNYWQGDILTNPPYKYAKEFVLKALESVDNGHKVIMFLKCQFLEGQNRYNDLFSKYPPKYVYIYSGRQKTAKGGDLSRTKSPTQCYCWFVWQKGFKGETILRWIP
jgi:hypothetical protein